MWFKLELEKNVCYDFVISFEKKNKINHCVDVEAYHHYLMYVLHHILSLL